MQNTNELIFELSSNHKIDPVHDTRSESSKYPIIATNKYFSGFNSLGFGSQSTLIIPNQGIVKQILLNMIFGTDGTTSKLNALPAYNAIQSIQYRIGGSTLYQISGLQNFNIALSQLRSQESIAELLLLAGGDQNVVLTAPLQVDAVISTPFSRFMLAGRQYGIDSSVFRTPIQVIVQLKPSALVYNAGVQASLVNGQFQVLQDEYLDMSHRLIPREGEFLTMNTRYMQGYQTRSFTPASVSTVNTVDLLGFRRGNLIGMIIACQDQANAVGGTPFLFNTLSDVDILFNGVSVYKAIGTNYKLQNLRNAPGSINYHTVNGVRQYRVECVFTPQQFGSAGMNLNHGLNLSSQVLTMSFKSSSIALQVLDITYIYGALVVYNETQQDIIL
jgi:hypothetical protein